MTIICSNYFSIEVEAPLTGQILFDGTFESGNFQSFRSNSDPNAVYFTACPDYGAPIQYGTAPGQPGWQVDTGDGSLMQICNVAGSGIYTAGEVRQGTYSLRTLVRNAANGGNDQQNWDDDGTNSTRRRTELSTHLMQANVLNLQPYLSERWQSVSVFIPADWDLTQYGWGPTIFQSKTPATNYISGNASLTIEGDSWALWNRVSNTTTPNTFDDINNPANGTQIEWNGSNSPSDASVIAAFPDETSSRTMLGNLNRGGWTDFVYRIVWDGRGASEGGTGLWDVWMRHNAQAWVKVLEFRAGVITNNGYTGDVGMGYRIPGSGWGTNLGMYMDVDQALNASPEREMYHDNFKIGDENCVFSQISPDGSEPPGDVIEPSQLWLGDNVVGEMGALAANDNWASTVYEYTPQYAPTIPTIPVPSTPLASDEVIISATDGAADFAAVMNDPQYTYIFIEKGADLYYGNNFFWGDYGTVTVGGSLGSPRWIVYYDPDTPSNVQDIRPWDQQQSDRVQMPNDVRIDGAGYINFVGLSFGIDGSRSQRAGSGQNGANNITYYRCLQEYIGETEFNGSGFFLKNSVGNNFTWYQSVFRNAAIPAREYDEILIQGGNGHKIISCEFKEKNNAFEQLGDQWDGTDIVIEDCDFYCEKRYDYAGNIDPAGFYAQGDAMVGPKGNMTNQYPNQIRIRIYGNRFWGAKTNTPNLDITGEGGDSGYMYGFSGNNPKYGCDFRYNVMLDASAGHIVMSQGQYGGNYHFVKYNLLTDSNDPGPISESNQTVYFNNSDSVFENNTVSEMEDPVLFELYQFPGAETTGMVIKNNFFQDTGGWNNEGNSRIVGEQIGYNAYAGTYTVHNVTLGNDQTYPGSTGKDSLNMGDFKFYRKKLTSPELVTVEGVVPTSSTPSSLTSGADT